MKQQITKAKEMLRRGLVTRDSENCWTVGDELDQHIVIKDVESGRCVLRCDCKNATLFCNSSPICYHLCSVILFESQEFRFKKILREIEEHLDGCEKLNMPINDDVLRNFINDLRGMV